MSSGADASGMDRFARADCVAIDAGVGPADGNGAADSGGDVVLDVNNMHAPEAGPACDAVAPPMGSPRGTGGGPSLTRGSVDF